jgi:hypothetical protein
MPFYPKKRYPVAEGGLKFDFSALQQENGNPNAAATGMAFGATDLIFGKDVKTDERGFQTSRSMGNYVGKNGIKGAAVGAQYGGAPGAFIGLAIGSAYGAVNGKNIQDKVARQNTMLATQNSNNLIQQGNGIYQNNLNRQSNSLYRAGGGFYPKPKSTAVMFKGGGVILDGERHSENGNPIVNDSGKTIAETEREELVLDADSSNTINEFMNMIDSNPTDMSYAQFGKIFAEKIFPNINDNSGKFNLNKPSKDFEV